MPVAPRVSKNHDKTPPVTLFRGAFPNYEEALVKGRMCLNDVTRLIKVARNKHDWKGISSYCLYNVCTNWDRALSRNPGESSKSA